MNYADVAIDADWIPPGKTFSYRIPRHLAVEPGQLVWVQFGRNFVQGLVLSLADASAVSEEETRDILHPVEPSPLVGSLGLELAEWLGQTYRCSPFEAVAPMLPPGFRAQQRSRLTAISGLEDAGELASFREATQVAWRELAGSSGAWEEITFLKRIDPSRANVARRELQRLVSRGLVRKEVSLPRPRSHRYRRLLIPGHHPDSGGKEVDAPQARATRQVELLAAVREAGAGYETTGVGPVADALLQRGLVGEEWQRVRPEVPSGVEPSHPAPAALTAAQSDALASITAALDDPGLLPRSFLLHGVTGSGKTEVYLRAIAHAVAQGKQAIYLVPRDLADPADGWHGERSLPRPRRRPAPSTD